MSVCRVTGLKILDRVGTHIFSGKDIIFCISKGISPIKMHIKIFLTENRKNIGFSSMFR